MFGNFLCYLVQLKLEITKSTPNIFRLVIEMSLNY